MDSKYNLSKEKLKIESFEVVSNINHHYASNEFSGGGVEAISVSTAHHSVRETWVKPLNGGDEFKLSEKYSILDVKSGHKITLLIDENDGIVVDVVNHDTGQRVTDYPKHITSKVDDKEDYEFPFFEGLFFSIVYEKLH